MPNETIKQDAAEATQRECLICQEPVRESSKLASCDTCVHANFFVRAWRGRKVFLSQLKAAERARRGG